MTQARRIAVIGLDCAPASLVFDEYRSDLPNLSRLMEQGSYAILASCHPPITVPAWSCLTSGYDAGQLGVYGFRNRSDYSYDGLSIATSQAIEGPRLWDHFDRAGRRSICLGVPQTYPITRPPRGVMISSFLTPDKRSPWISPATLADEIDRVAEGNYLIDVPNFRTSDKSALLEQIHAMTRRRFAVARHLARTQPWDLFMTVEMGTDRLHHAFWHYADSTHPRFAGEDHPLRWTMRDYYRQLDAWVGELLLCFDDDVLVVVVSDHGARSLNGGIAVNEWLIEQGYLVLEQYPDEPTPLARLAVDWSRTAAWSEGGYYARVFLNVRGREPQGLIEPRDYETWRDRLIGEMQHLPGPAGEPLGTRVERPEALFKECRGVPPDLMCYWGNLSWRSVGTVGHRRRYVFENDTGPDEANHDWNGIFISRDPLEAGRGRVSDQRLLDVGPSLLQAAGLSVPTDTAGSAVIRWHEKER
jgi:predicted AlkP superfamily phosphohydrolase/phosphomutase